MKVLPWLECALTEREGRMGTRHTGTGQRKDVLGARNLLCEHITVRARWLLKVFLLSFLLFSNVNPFRRHIIKNRTLKNYKKREYLKYFLNASLVLKICFISLDIPQL